MSEDKTLRTGGVTRPPAPPEPADQPKAGLMWLCRTCGDGLVARGAEGSGYCRPCFEALTPAGEGTS